MSAVQIDRQQRPAMALAPMRARLAGQDEAVINFANNSVRTVGLAAAANVVSKPGLSDPSGALVTAPALQHNRLQQHLTFVTRPKVSPPAGLGSLTGVKLVHVVINKTAERTLPLPAVEPPVPAFPLQKHQHSPSTSSDTSDDAVVNACTRCGIVFDDKPAFNAHVKLHLKEKLARRAKQQAPASRSPQLLSPSPTLPFVTETSTTATLSSKPRVESPMMVVTSGPSRTVIKTEAATQCESRPRLSAILETPSSSVSVPAAGQDQFVKSEFSKEMEINRDDLNKDISSILDQIEKDFDAASLRLSPPPTVTATAGPATAASFLDGTEFEPSGKPPEFNEDFGKIGDADFSLAEGAGSDEDGGQAIAFEKLLDLNNLAQESLSKTDGFFAKESEGTRNGGSRFDELGLSSRTEAEGGPRLAEIGAGYSAGGKICEEHNLFSQSPGKLVIQRSPTNPGVLNIYRVADLSPASVGAAKTQPIQIVTKRPATAVDSHPSPPTKLAKIDHGSGCRVPASPVVRNRHSSNCGVCGKTITTKNMARHMEKHTGKKKFRCEVCKAAFYQKTHLKNHSALHESPSSRSGAESEPAAAEGGGNKQPARRSCKHCTFRTHDEAALQQHLIKEHSINNNTASSVKKELCGVCGEKLDGRPAMIAHMREHAAEDAGATVYACHVCEQTFGRRSQLARHLQAHREEASYACHLCQERFPTELELLSHAALHPCCAVCKNRFNSHVELGRHAAKAHPGPAPDSAPRPFSFMSPRSMSSVDADFPHDEDDSSVGGGGGGDFCLTPSPARFGSLISPCPSSSADSYTGELWEPGIPQFFSHLEAGEELEQQRRLENGGGDGGKRSNLSLDAISDSSYFSIDNHLDDDLLAADLFAT